MDGATINPLSAKTKTQDYKAEDAKVQLSDVQDTENGKDSRVANIVKNTEDSKNVDNDEKKEATEQIAHAAKLFNRKIQLEFEKSLNITIAKVIDTETDEVVRQIPLEELIELARKSKDLKGLLIDKTS